MDSERAREYLSLFAKHFHLRLKRVDLLRNLQGFRADPCFSASFRSVRAKWCVPRQSLAAWGAGGASNANLHGPCCGPYAFRRPGKLSLGSEETASLRYDVYAVALAKTAAASGAKRFISTRWRDKQGLPSSKPGPCLTSGSCSRSQGPRSDLVLTKREWGQNPPTM